MIPAHPRSRGEHRYDKALLGQDCGSSPLTRRTQPQPHQQRLRRRLVPTNVGNTDSPGRTVPAGSAHPRSRGEHRGARIRIPFSPGSSPLARGAQRVPAGLLRGLRLIPACAENTSAHDPKSTAPPAHPRSRGEQWSRQSLTNARPGSSPLVRGTRIFRD